MAEEQAATENSLLRLAQYLESINRATWQAAGDERLSRTIMGQIEKRDKKKADDIEKQRIAAETLADEEKRKKLEAAKQSGFFQKLVDHFSWQRDYTEREAKKENRMMSRIKDFGKTQVDMLKSAAKGLFDLLLTGLGLIALYKLFQWLREQDWEQLYNDVVQFAQEMLDEFNFVINAFLEVGGLLAKMTGLFWAYYLFSKFTSWDEATKALGLFLDKFSFKNLFGPDSKIRRILRGIQSLFGGATIVEAVDDVDVKRGFISRWFGADSPIRRMLRFIGRIFGGAIRFALNIATGGGFGAMFGKEGGIQKLLGWVKGFFGGEGRLVTAFKAISTNPQILKVVNFLKTVGAKMLKFLGPVTWLIAGYDAIAGEGGFMDTFNKTEGSLWEKTVAGLSAAIQSLVDFFVFDTVQLIEDFVKWSIKKLAGLFGIEEKDVEGAEWYKFSITDFLRDFFGDIMLYLEGIYTLDTGKMAEGIKGMWGKFKGLVDWFYGTLVTPLIQWVAKNLFGFSEEEANAIEFKPMQWLEDNFLTPLFNWLEGLFSMDFDAMAKSIMPDWLYNFFSGSGGEKVTEDLFASGGFIDDAGYNSINADEIRKMIDSTSGDQQKKLMNQLVAAYRDNTGNLESVEQEKLKLLLNEYGASLNRGGYVPPGVTVPAILHGPEVVKPLKEVPIKPEVVKPIKEIPIKESTAMNSGAPVIVNAPSTTSNVSSSPTSVMMGVSSTDPNKALLSY